MAWDNIPFTPALEGLARQTCAVCFGSLAQRSIVSRETIGRFLDAMPEGEGRYKIFDINLRQGFYTKEILCSSMRKCNVLKINDEELVTVSRMFGYPGIDLQDKCWILLAKYNLKMLILTCGVNGSYVFTPGNISFVETPKVEVADTVGSRRFIHRILCGGHSERQACGRSAQTGSRGFGLCLHTERSDACPSRLSEGQAWIKRRSRCLYAKTQKHSHCVRSKFLGHLYLCFCVLCANC